jgi:hypothetical protein
MGKDVSIYPQMFDMILKHERRNKAEDDNGETLIESQVTVIVDDIDKCDECTSEGTCVSCIMAKAKAFELDESVIDEEEYKRNEESLECIMAKARAFELDESFLDEEV